MEQVDLETRWLGGREIPGVRYKRNDIVRLLDGPFAGELGSVVGLLGTEPEPCYRVTVEASGVELEMSESSLGTA
jgi:transcription antitermination factor NusG